MGEAIACPAETFIKNGLRALKEMGRDQATTFNIQRPTEQ